MKKTFSLMGSFMQAAFITMVSVGMAPFMCYEHPNGGPAGWLLRAQSRIIDPVPEVSQASSKRQTSSVVQASTEACLLSVPAWWAWRPSS